MCEFVLSEMLLAQRMAEMRAATADIRLIAVCSPDFLRPDWPMGLETLLTLPLLQDAHRRWEKLIHKTGYGDTHKLLNFDRPALALDATIGGHGIAIAPTYMYMVENDLRSKKLVGVWDDPAPLTLVYISHVQKTIWARRASSGSLSGLHLNSSEADLRVGKADGSKVRVVNAHIRALSVRFRDLS